ncbi:MAG TPA: RHS repeat domain-containing protein [Candidatus Acidoferrales bacterium]|nr:RHS repeat domain-containing protein [Candidatus Acidoferrales bacterium]
MNGNWVYTFDDFNRLLTAACSSHCPDGQNTQAFSYVYDRYANLWQKNLTAGSGASLGVTFTTGNNNRIDTYSYDSSGNLQNDGTHQYAYDAQSQITKVDSGSTATYLYDADGRRVQKTTASGTVNYVYDLAGHEIAEINSSGAWTREEVYAGGHHLMTYSGGVSGTTAGGSGFKSLKRLLAVNRSPQLPQTPRFQSRHFKTIMGGARSGT